MWIRLINEAWTLEVKKIALYPSFHSKLFLAHDFLKSFSYEFTMKLIKVILDLKQVRLRECTCTSANVQVQVQMYIFVTFHTLTFQTLTDWLTDTDSEETRFKLGASKQALILMISHVDFDCVVDWRAFVSLSSVKKFEPTVSWILLQQGKANLLRTTEWTGGHRDKKCVF